MDTSAVSSKNFWRRKRKENSWWRQGRSYFEWWNVHYKWPYPSKTYKVALAESTGVDPKYLMLSSSGSPLLGSNLGSRPLGMFRQIMLRPYDDNFILDQQWVSGWISSTASMTRSTQSTNSSTESTTESIDACIYDAIFAYAYGSTTYILAPGWDASMCALGALASALAYALTHFFAIAAFGSQSRPRQGAYSSSKNHLWLDMLTLLLE